MQKPTVLNVMPKNESSKTYAEESKKKSSSEAKKGRLIFKMLTYPKKIKLFFFEKINFYGAKALQ